MLPGVPPALETLFALYSFSSRFSSEGSCAQGDGDHGRLYIPCLSRAWVHHCRGPMSSIKGLQPITLLLKALPKPLYHGKHPAALHTLPTIPARAPPAMPQPVNIPPVLCLPRRATWCGASWGAFLVHFLTPPLLRRAHAPSPMEPQHNGLSQSTWHEQMSLGDNTSAIPTVTISLPGLGNDCL